MLQLVDVRQIAVDQHRATPHGAANIADLSSGTREDWIALPLGTLVAHHNRKYKTSIVLRVY